MELIKISSFMVFLEIQGFRNSEPIPISSSGHLNFSSIFEKNGTNGSNERCYFEVIVNDGSLLAIIYYYRHDIVRLFMSFLWLYSKTKKETITKVILDTVFY